MRFSYLLLWLGSLPLGVQAAAQDPLKSVMWDSMQRTVLGCPASGCKGLVFDDRVVVQVPPRVEDGRSVPVLVDARALGTVKTLVLFADYNPIPRAVQLRLHRAEPRFAVSMRVNQATPIRAAALDAQGVWHIGSQWLEAPGGGCALPSPTRNTTDWDRVLGRVNGRAWTEAGGRLRLRLSIMHPMDTGLVSNVPRFNLETLTLSDAQGTPLVALETDAALAESPLFTLHLPATTSPFLRVSGQDNDGNAYQATLPVVP